MTLNAVGREVPPEICGRKLRPYEGHLSSPMARAVERKIAKQKGKDKLRASLKKAIELSRLEDGMTVSFHHALRNGDEVINKVASTLDEMGFRNLRFAPTAVFPKHEPLINYIKSGLISRFEGSMNGPVGAAVSKGILSEPAVLRSHGGRPRAMESGELRVDVAFIAASAADIQGNCTGMIGKSAFGPMGFAYSDAWFARNVVVVTDEIVDYPTVPMSIQESYVDHVVEVESIGDPAGIASGTLKITADPDRLRIAEQVTDIIELSGLLKKGFSFQAGAGGTSLAVVKFLHERMQDKGIVGDFAVGGVTKLVVDMLHDGTIKTIIDAQAFDTDAVKSLREDRNHLEVSHYHLMNPHTKSCVVHHQDVCFLGATEVDVNFNANVNTHSDGRLLHGIGGHQDAASGSKICFILCPLYRKDVPIVRERVTTVTTPGQDVDVIATDHGIAVNPLRRDLLKKVEDSGLPLKSIEELKDLSYEMTGGPPEAEFADEPIAIIEYRDGTVLDLVRKVAG